MQIDDLMEANSKLEMDKQQSMNESGNLAYQLEQARGTMDGTLLPFALVFVCFTAAMVY